MALFSAETEKELKTEALSLVAGFLESYARPKTKHLGLMSAVEVRKELGIKANTLKRWEMAGLRRYQPPLEDTRKVFYKIKDILIFLGVDDNGGRA